MNYNNNQLNSISTQYRKFSKGQYVEHTQFNEFLDFFEDQDRLSRVMLEGVGIVCGFKPQLIYTNKQISSLELSQGVAITTDGDLLTLSNGGKVANVSSDSYLSDLKTIKLDSKSYTHWKPYSDHKVKYDAFHDEFGNQMELWELATSAEAKTDFQPLANFYDLENKYLLLYLESYEKEAKPCRGVDCDSHGIQQIRNLKVLVTTAYGISQILNSDNVAPHPVFTSALRDEKIKRVILAPKQETPEHLRQLYKDVIDEGNYNSMFRAVDIISGIMNIPLVGRAGFLETINHLADQNYNFQYTYGAFKDLTDTYTEIVALLPKSFMRFLPDLHSFPKHIMLGKLASDTKLEYTRHQFYNSPILDTKKTSQRVRTLIERFNQQTLAFRDPTEIGAKNGIRITPSQEMSPLGTKAIPFYYYQTEKFLNSWSFDKTKNRAATTNLSFDTALLSQDEHIQRPTSFNIDKNTFYRIEGHQGIPYEGVISSFGRLNRNKSLRFEVMALSLEDLGDNKNLNKAYFTDYVELHPGLEFLGGVRPGGTFVIVYKSEKEPTVIADFALPYICCTPKSDVVLSLPVSTICKDAAPVNFTITPSNGVVKADFADETIKGGVENYNGQYRFNPALIDNNLLDKEIRFTVNGKPTNCSISVVPPPVVRILPSNFAYPDPGSSNTVVTFTVTNISGGNYDYKWDFLGNGSYVAVKPDAKGTVKYTYFRLDPTKPINVLVSGNGCTQKIPLKDWYVPQPTQNQPPTVTVTTSPAAIYWPDKDMKMYSSVIAGSGTVNYYLWSCTNTNVIIGDKNASTVGVTFPSAGSYTIKLTVRDTNAMEGTTSITVSVGTKASVSGVTINLQSPTSNDEVIAQATVLNPSFIGGLKYQWYLDGTPVAQTDTNVQSFGKLNVGDRKIDVGLFDSAGGNHLNNVQSVAFTVKEGSRIGTSFLAGTQITMADGSRKKVEAIKVGEELKSLDGKSRVLSTVNYISLANVYRLNDNDPFITGAHPVRTERGWKSFDPVKTREMISSIQVDLLQLNDVLIMENGVKIVLKDTSSIKGPNQVYNLEVGGSKDFFANGYSVYSEIESGELETAVMQR